MRWGATPKIPFKWTANTSKVSFQTCQIQAETAISALDILQSFCKAEAAAKQQRPKNSRKLSPGLHPLQLKLICPLPLFPHQEIVILNTAKTHLTARTEFLSWLKRRIWVFLSILWFSLLARQKMDSPSTVKALLWTAPCGWFLLPVADLQCQGQAGTGEIPTSSSATPCSEPVEASS